MVGVDNRWPEQMAPVMDGGEGGFGWLTGWDFYEGNKSKFLTQGALPLSLIHNDGNNQWLLFEYEWVILSRK